MKDIVLLVHDIRSTHNVGAFFRTCDGLGVNRIIFSGYTPYPTIENDTRLPHLADKLTRQIHKTALGSESYIPFEYHQAPPIESLKSKGYEVIGLEVDEQSIPLSSYRPADKVALLLGNEIHGISNEHRQFCDQLIEIPMKGQKESFNVSVAAGIALYHLTHK